MTDEALIDSVLEQTRLFASWVHDADPTLPVPSCPDWKLADLVEHVGATQQWVASLTEGRITDPQAAFALTSGRGSGAANRLDGLATEKCRPGRGGVRRRLFGCGCL